MKNNQSSIKGGAGVIHRRNYNAQKCNEKVGNKNSTSLTAMSEFKLRFTNKKEYEAIQSTLFKILSN